jgi:uncharacterized protein with beta-barrel porin domain
LSGEFDGAISDLAFLDPLLDYRDGRHVYLSFERGEGFGSYALSGNQRAVAAALETLPAGSSLLADILGNATKGQAGDLLNQLSGEIHSSAPASAFALDRGFERGLFRRVSQAAWLKSGLLPGYALAGGGPGLEAPAAGDDGAVSPRHNIWVSMGGSHSKASASSEAASSALSGLEVSGGYDANLADGWIGGVAFRFADMKLEVDDRRSEADIDSFTAAVYGGRLFRAGPGVFRLVLNAAYSRHDIGSERSVSAGALSQTLKADYSADSFAASLEGAYAFRVGEKAVLEPFASVGWARTKVDGFGETGGNAALARSGQSASNAFSALGLRARYAAHGRVSLGAEPGWRRVYGRLNRAGQAAFLEGGRHFSVTGQAMSRDEALASLSGAFSLTDKVGLAISYDGAFGRKNRSHGVMASLNVAW